MKSVIILISRIHADKEIYSVNLSIQSEYGKIWTRTTPNTETFYAIHNPHRALQKPQNHLALLPKRSPWKMMISYNM